MSDQNSTLQVYYDGSCPLCRKEIAHYRQQPGAERLCFRDVSRSETDVGADLTREHAMARFHVRNESGQLISGAAAFVEIWGRLESWSWAARAARWPGVLRVLEAAYRAFLPVRKTLARYLDPALRRYERMTASPSVSDRPVSRQIAGHRDG